jgi:ABC-type phosphate transport system substrate-binding protein
VVRKVSGWSPDIFRREVMGDREFVDGGVVVDSKEAVVAEVAARPWAIGFSGLGVALDAQDRVRLVRLVDDESSADATFALNRPLYLYTAGESEALGAFLDFVLGSRAQGMLLETGIFPVRPPESGEPGQ